MRPLDSKCGVCVTVSAFPIQTDKVNWDIFDQLGDIVVGGILLPSYTVQYLAVSTVCPTILFTTYSSSSFPGALGLSAVGNFPSLKAGIL